VHWENDPGDDQMQAMATGAGGLAVPKYLQALQEPQWINCDVRNFDWSILGKFGVIMTDPPWHIRQVCVCIQRECSQPVCKALTLLESNAILILE
jgi:mRNA (2'-O-methyladenosine-N6-)-methyltransferase